MLSKSSIDEKLTKTALLFSRTVSPEEFEIWEQCLDHQPMPAIDYAFDAWQRNGRWFPKPADILQLIAVWKDGRPDKNRFIPCGRDGCIDGWVTVTPPGVDKKLRRCECFNRWAAARRAA